MTDEFATVRNGTIVCLQGYAPLIAEIAANKIDYGLGRNITKALTPKSIRVVQVRIDDDEFAESGSGGSYSIWRPYVMHVVAIFEIDATGTEKTAEDDASKYDGLMRKALTNEPTLGGTATKIRIGRTFFLTHAEQEKVKMVLLEVTALKRVQSS